MENETRGLKCKSVAGRGMMTNKVKRMEEKKTKEKGRDVTIDGLT